MAQSVGTLKSVTISVTVSQLEETERETHVAVDSNLVAQLVADEETIQDFCDNINSLKGIDVFDKDATASNDKSLLIYTIAEYNEAIGDIA